MTQTTLPLTNRPVFSGADYDPARDDGRLTSQMERIASVMSDGNWWTLNAIAELTGDPPASISAQLRHLRKPQFGARCVERRYIGNGVYEYRML